ncbi:MAG TPA: PAS domain-containing protein [Myxococcales bacterium]|nr:PAS domain-containing protein [Myxococcales bacterium]
MLDILAMSNLREILAGVFDAFFVVDQDRKVKEQNRSFVELSGAGGGSAMAGHLAHCYDRIKLEICNKDCIALRALKAGRAVQVKEIHGTSLDGRQLVLMGSATPVKDAAGNVESVLVFYRDVTEESSVREKLHHLENEAKQENDILLKKLGEKMKEVDDLRSRLTAAQRGR